MSGPKRSEVEAVLRDAVAIRQRCATKLAASKNIVVSSLVADANRNRAESASATKEAHTAEGRLGAEAARLAPGAVKTFKSAIEESRRLEATAKSAGDQAADGVANVTKALQAADKAFSAAERSYSSAQAALARRGGEHHGFYDEKRLAEQARAALAEAESAANHAATAQDRLLGQAQTALSAANAAKNAAKSVAAQAASVAREVEARRRAEEEARKIAEESRRIAVESLGAARAALDSVGDTSHEKFAPGRFEPLEIHLMSASNLLKGGKSSEARTEANAVQVEANRLRVDVIAAEREYQRRRSAAEAGLSAFDATMPTIDRDAVANWSGDSDACQEAESEQALAKQHFAAERFEEAVACAKHATESIRTAFADAIDNQAKHEQRTMIGDAISEALEEMGFQVSFDDGTLAKPMMIGAQTVKGVGDVMLKIPLNGEIGFTVEESEGSEACVATVQQIRDELGKRGFQWTTTSWGHARNPETVNERAKELETEKQKTIQSIVEKSKS